MYKIQIEHFEGPLDLLLQLIEKEKLDITKISMAKITDEYIEHVEELDTRSTDVAEFLVVASKLIYLKSKAIIPTFGTEDKEEEIDDLEAKLLEYKKYKEAAKRFHETLESGYKSFQRKNGPKIVFQKFTPPEGVDLNMLMDILQEVIANVPEKEVEEKEEVFEKKISIEEKITELKTYFAKNKKSSFKKILKKASTKHEIIVSFLAILDLIKQKHVDIEQEGNFSDIIVIAVSR